MRRFVFGEDEFLIDWVQQRLPHARFNLATAIGLESDGKLIAACVYSNYLPTYGNIEMSIAADSPLWARKEAIDGFLRYPFAQLGCRRVTAITPGRNLKARKFLTKIGFRKEGCMQQGYGNDDAILYGLLKKHWKEKSIGKI